MNINSFGPNGKIPSNQQPTQIAHDGTDVDVLAGGKKLKTVIYDVQPPVDKFGGELPRGQFFDK